MALKQFKARVLTPISDTTRTEKRRSSSRFPFSLSSLSAYLGVFLLIVSVVAMTYQPPQRQALASTSGLTGNTALNDVSQPTVDSMLATSVGATIAERTELPVAGNVLSLSQSLSIENTLAQTDTNTISKPQIVQPTADGRTPQQYTTITGDTIPTIAQRYNISAQTVKWANNLTSDAVAPGKTLTIPPTDGILYTVKSGDTVDSIAAKYKADKQLLITYNDLEVTGTPVVGSRILIPGGDLPATEQPGYVAPRRAVTYNYNYATYSGGQANGTAYYWTAGASPGNRYGMGQCTFYAYERRLQLGNPVGGMWGNANTWAYSAASSSYLVDGNPTPGAVMANGGGYGHVAIVESIVPGVSISISEMNGYRWGGGWNRVGFGTISWGEATSGMYKYIH